VSPHDLEGARTEVETARAALAAEEREIRAGRARLAALHAQASLDRRAVADTVVRAPFAGRVVRRIAEVGEVATQGSPVLELVDVGPLRVRFEVPEDLALAVATGQRVRVRATMDPERTYDAEIRVVAGALDPLQHPERRGGARRRTPARRRRLRRGRADPGRPGARSDPA
jgi:multidrug resistance efflux pump